MVRVEVSELFGLGRCSETEEARMYMQLALLPLGLALWLFPLMWNTGYHAFK